MIDLFISHDNFLAHIVALTGRAEETLGMARFTDTGDSGYWTLVVGEVEFRQILVRQSLGETFVLQAQPMTCTPKTSERRAP